MMRPDSENHISWLRRAGPLEYQPGNRSHLNGCYYSVQRLTFDVASTVDAGVCFMKVKHGPTERSAECIRTEFEKKANIGHSDSY